MEDGTYTAVVDRFETDQDDERLAVLLVEDDGVVGDLVVPASDLPDDARHVDAVLEVDVVDEDLAKATYLPEETERRREDAQSRFDRLSRRPGDGDESDDEGDG